MTAVVARLDLYPARLTVVYAEDPSKNVSYLNARVIVTADRLYGFIDAPDGSGPMKAVDLKFDEFDGDNTHGWLVELSDGGVAEFSRSSGCGCGSRLRGFRPFPEGLTFGAF